MTCELKYISDSKNGFTPDQIEQLTDKHVEVAKTLYKYRYYNKSGKQELFKLGAGKLVFPTGNVEAINLVKILNRDEEIIKIIPDELNSLRSYISIDVRPLAYKNIEVDQESMVNFYKNMFGDSNIVTSDESVEAGIRDAKHKEVWNTLTESVRGKLTLYLKSLPDTGDKYGTIRKELNELLSIMNDKSELGILESLSYYITTASHSLNNISGRLNQIDNIVKNLSDDPTVKKEQLRNASNFVRHSSYFYHLFDILSDIDIEFRKAGIQSVTIDNYDRISLEDSLKNYLSELEFTAEEIQTFLDETPNYIGDTGNMFGVIKNIYKSKVEDLSLSKVEEMERDFNILINESLKPEGNIFTVLQNSISGLVPFKSKLKDLHYDTLSEIYFPILEDAYNRGNDEYKAKFPLDKERFKTMLRIGEEDINWVTKWGSAMINVNEVVAQTIANYFKDMMIDVDMNNKKDVTEIQRLIQEKDQTKLNQIYSNSVSDAYILEEIKEVDSTYIAKSDEIVVDIPMFDVNRKYVARKTRNLLQETDTLKLHNLRSVFKSLQHEKAQELASQLKVDKYSLLDLKNSGDSILRNLYDIIYYTDRNSGKEYIRNSVAASITNETIDEKINTLLGVAFRKDNLSYLTNDEVKTKFEKDGITKDYDFIDLNSSANKSILKTVRRNSYSVQYKNNNLEALFNASKSSLFGIENGAAKRILVRYKNGQFDYVDVYNVNDETQIDADTSQIEYFYNFSESYQKLNESKYSIKAGGFTADARNKYNLINSDTTSKTLFDALLEKYKGGIENHGRESLRFNEVPQVNKLEEAGVVDKVKAINKDTFTNYAKEFIYNENKFALKNKEGQLVDEDGNLVDSPVYQTSERLYVNGQKVRTIDAKFVRPIPLANLETDLYKSILMYKTGSNLYKSLKDNESQALLLQSIIEGDSTLGIEKRKMKVKKIGKDVKVAGGQIEYKEHNVNTSELMMSFINDYIYGINKEDVSILGLSGKKVAETISGYTAYTSLAWNFLTMPSNALISAHNTRSVAKGNEFFNEKDWKESYTHYYASVPQLMKDFGNKGLTIEKSALTQMIIRFNAIQGEFLSPKGQLESQGLGKKMADSALYWTQEVVEHMNQTSSMIMLMKGYMLPSGTSLWNAIEAKNKGLTGELLMPEEFTPELERQFQKRLQAVNLVIHGNYSKLDQNMMQKGILTNMFMMFRKYIYDGFRARFESERQDIQTATIQEGFFRTYFNQMNKELIEQVKTQGLSLALTPQIIKALGTTMLKATLGGLDSATFNLMSKNNENFKEFIHGKNLSERQRFAAVRSMYGTANVIRLLLIIAIVQGLKEGLDDDDEGMKKLLSYVELFSRKLESDIGFFESGTNIASGIPTLTTLDGVLKIMRDPFVAYRSVDNTVGIFKQITDFDFRDDEGNFQVHWGAFDQYEKSGRGYEKGDYKINRKLEKSVVSPFWQFVKLLSPEEQINYMDLVYKHSK